jgi:NAD(P)-dependent dehydrogenase (short-subunit alcohol dehydrogenase family)
VDKIFHALLSKRDISRTLNKIREAGATAEYICADVTDIKSIKVKLAPVVARLGPVTGLIHGAGVLADRRIEDKTVADFMAVYATKVNGLEALLGCVAADRLTHLSLFSSAAGFFGNAGQADYSIANEILNKTAFRFKALHPACHVNAFNWGPWDGGMVTPELKRMFTEKNIAVIPMEAGSRLFANELAAADSTTQILVGSSMQAEPYLGRDKLESYRITRQLGPEDNPFLKDHVIGKKPVLPTVCAASWMAESCEMLSPGFRFFSATGYKMFKGIVFEEGLAQHYILDIDEVEKNPDHIEFNVNISSRKKNGATLHHYASGIRLVRQLPEPPVYAKADFEVTKVIDGRQLYRDGTLFHGPNFQGIERVINLNDHQLTLECRLPEVALRDQGQFRVGTINPYAADVQFQCMLIWVRQNLDAASLPAQAQIAEHYMSVPVGRKFYVSLAVKSSSSASVTADIISHDREGRIYSRIKEAKVIVSKQLDRLFSKAG